MKNRVYIKDLKDNIGKEIIIAGSVDVRRDQGKMVFFDFRAKGCAFFERALAYLMLLGWIPGLVIAIIAHKMRQRMKGSILLINTTRNFVVLAMLGTLGFGIFEIFAMLLNHFAPRG